MGKKRRALSPIAAGLLVLALSAADTSRQAGAEGSPSMGRGAVAKGASNAALLPDEETIVYSRKVGDRIDRVETSLRLVLSQGGSYYEAHSSSKDQDSLFRMDAETFFANYVETTSRDEEATIKRITSIEENRMSPKEGEILVSGLESLPYALRAFPWGKQQKAKISFPGSRRQGDYRFDFVVSGKESVEAGGTKIECWKAQISMGGFLGSLVGKSSYWFSAESPHYLVKSESPGAMGSPATTLELLSYSSSTQH
jgi:hypothetical protein